ncbi:MAG: hypothetical protein WBD03_06035 [Thermoplasmata archaeon]
MGQFVDLELVTEDPYTAEPPTDLARKERTLTKQSSEIYLEILLAKQDSLLRA